MHRDRSVNSFHRACRGDYNTVLQMLQDGVDPDVADEVSDLLVSPLRLSCLSQVCSHSV